LLVYGVRTASLAGGSGDDYLSAAVDGGYSGLSDGNAVLDENATLDGGEGNDSLYATGYNSYTGYGQTRLDLHGGVGNDALTVSDFYAGSYYGNAYGIAQAALDGGDGDDRLSAGGVLQLSLSGGSGADTFVLTAQQWRTQLEGTRTFSNADGTSTEVAAGPTVITDFQAGADGDVLDVNELLATSGYVVDAGTNPFATGGPLQLQQVDGAVQLQFQGTTVALLQGVVLEQLVVGNISPAFDPSGNLAPTAQDAQLTLAEDGAYVFSAADFGFADPDAGNTLQAVTLLTLPEQGRLTLHGQAISAGERIGIGALESGALVFVPAADAHADAYARIGFSVSDGRLDSVARTLVLDVASVNDAPQLQLAMADLVAAQDHAFSVDLPAGMFTDVDDTHLSLTVTQADGSALPSWLGFDTATQRLSGTPLAADAGANGQVLELLVTATDASGASVSDLLRLSIDASLNLNGNGAANRLEGRSADDRLNGLAGNDTLNGLDGDDTLDGGSGADRLLGGRGDDVYRIDNSRDVVIELAGEGLDRVEASVNHTLAAEVEQLTLTGREDLRGSGNALDNLLVGNRGDNALDGGAGDDRLVGGAGDDTLTGGLGADVFVFDAMLNARSNIDELRDFRHGTDHLELDASVFTTLAGLDALGAGMLRTGSGVSQALDADDHMIYDTSSGQLYYDADGAGGAAAVQFAQIKGAVKLTVDDFLIGG
jgi:serralysin